MFLPGVLSQRCGWFLDVVAGLQEAWPVKERVSEAGMRTAGSGMWEVPQDKWPDFLTNVCQGKNDRILQIKRLKELTT